MKKEKDLKSAAGKIEQVGSFKQNPKFFAVVTSSFKEKKEKKYSSGSKEILLCPSKTGEQSFTLFYMMHILNSVVSYFPVSMLVSKTFTSVFFFYVLMLVSNLKTFSLNLIFMNLWIALWCLFVDFGRLHVFVWTSILFLGCSFENMRKEHISSYFKNKFKPEYWK